MFKSICMCCFISLAFFPFSLSYVWIVQAKNRFRFPVVSFYHLKVRPLQPLKSTKEDSHCCYHKINVHSISFTACPEQHHFSRSKKWKRFQMKVKKIHKLRHFFWLNEKYEEKKIMNFWRRWEQKCHLLDCPWLEIIYSTTQSHTHTIIIIYQKWQSRRCVHCSITLNSFAGHYFVSLKQKKERERRRERARQRNGDR